MNGDGFDDLIIGAYTGDDGGAQAGEAYVVFGGSGGFGTAVGGRQVIDLSSLSGTDGFIIQGDEAGDLAARSVSSGDVNGDGFGDLIVGAYYGDDGGNYAGEAYVVFGSSGGLGTAVGGRQIVDLTSLSGPEGFIIQGDVAGDEAGRSVSSAGDVNGDGFDDLIVGARLGDDGGANAGEAYVVFGKSSGFGTAVSGPVIDLTNLSGTDGFIIQGDTANRSGRLQHFSSAGDVNGDGFDDLIVGASYGDDGGANAGEAYVVFGKSSGFGTAVGGRQVIDLTSLSGTDGFIIQGDVTGDRAGFSVSSAGDVEQGNRVGDLIVGARSGDDGGNYAGEAYLIFGSDFLGRVMFAGTAGPDMLSGTGAAETFVAGQGDDTLTGGGGADAFQGGEGDDTIIVGSVTPLDLNGGSGTDTVNLNSLGAVIDLSGTRQQPFHRY